MTSFVLQMKDPRWVETPNSPGSSDWEAVAARILPAIGKSLSAEAREAISGEICLVLANDAQITELNKAWRGKDGPTNVLSFPAEDDSPDIPQTGGNLEESQDESVLGDVVFAFETIAREAAEQGKSFHNHVAHLLVHGVLHLLGYDHQSDEDAGQMESLERRILATLDIADPYGVPDSAGDTASDAAQSQD